MWKQYDVHRCVHQTQKTNNSALFWNLSRKTCEFCTKCNQFIRCIIEFDNTSEGELHTLNQKHEHPIDRCHLSRNWAIWRTLCTNWWAFMWSLACFLGSSRPFRSFLVNQLLVLHRFYRHHESHTVIHTMNTRMFHDRRKALSQYWFHLLCNINCEENVSDFSCYWWIVLHEYVIIIESFTTWTKKLV